MKDSEGVLHRARRTYCRRCVHCNDVRLAIAVNIHGIRLAVTGSQRRQNRDAPERTISLAIRHGVAGKQVQVSISIHIQHRERLAILRLQWKRQLLRGDGRYDGGCGKASGLSTWRRKTCISRDWPFDPWAVHRPADLAHDPR